MLGWNNNDFGNVSTKNSFCTNLLGFMVIFNNKKESNGAVLPKILVFWSPKNSLVVYHTWKMFELHIYCHQTFICILSIPFWIKYLKSFKYIRIKITTNIQFICTQIEIIVTFQKCFQALPVLYIHKNEYFRLHQIFSLNINIMYQTSMSGSLNLLYWTVIQYLYFLLLVPVH